VGGDCTVTPPRFSLAQKRRSCEPL